CGTVDDHILDDRVRSGAQRLQLDGVTIVEGDQALLAGRLVLVWAVRTVVHHQATGTTDTLAAVRGQGGWRRAILDVHGGAGVQQLRDGPLLCGVITLDGLEVAFGVRARLTPNFKIQLHYL